MSHEIALVLNRFAVKPLTEGDRTFWVYTCRFDEPPEGAEFYRRLASVAYRVGVVAVSSRSGLFTRDSIAPEHLQGEGWGLTLQGTRVLDAQRPGDRQILESFERRFLETELRRTFRKLEVERAAEGGLIWWVKDEAGVQKSGNGWEIHRGRHIDIHIEENGQLYLEVDLHYRFHTPQTLHWWLTQFPELEDRIRHVRNTYCQPNESEYLGWLYEGCSDESPAAVQIPNLGISLAEYHRRAGATEEAVQTSKVVYVKRQKLDRTPVAHLSQRLTPSLTLEMLSSLLEIPDNKQLKEEVFACFRAKLDTRLTESQTTANLIRQRVYNLTTEVAPMPVMGVALPKATLLAKGDRPIKQVANVSYHGCAASGEVKLGCLNLFSKDRKYPDAVRKCLDKVAQSTGVDLNLDSFRTLQDYPEEGLAQNRFWQSWAQEGIRTVLVVMDRASNERKQMIRKQALQAGIATQFMVPKDENNNFKAMNVVLGLLCKAGWQPVRLQPQENWADLVVGFDTGTDRSLYYGTSAFAVLADGQSLGWELPNVQTGEKFTGAAIWRTVSNLILRFEEKCDRPPRKVLLMRDGLVQSDEFEETIGHLTKEQIDVDVLGVRKSGTGRLGILQNGIYQDAPLGSTVFWESEKSFLMITSQAINKSLGSARPLRVVHNYGDTPLTTLAVQTYHLTQMHPASGFRASRLPWVLHLADRSSKEFQRLGDIGLLQNLDRTKLIAV